MKRVHKDNSRSLLLSFLVNLVLNLEWLIPAAILLVLHFWLDISIWWFVGAVGVWILVVTVWACVFGYAASCGSMRDAQKENKNPYSNKNNKLQ